MSRHIVILCIINERHRKVVDSINSIAAAKCKNNLLHRCTRDANDTIRARLPSAIQSHNSQHEQHVDVMLTLKRIMTKATAASLTKYILESTR